MASQVTLVFENDEEKNKFLDGMCDTWGFEELELDVRWAGELHTTEQVFVHYGLFNNDETSDPELNALLEGSDERDR